MKCFVSSWAHGRELRTSAITANRLMLSTALTGDSTNRKLRCKCLSVAATCLQSCDMYTIMGTIMGKFFLRVESLSQTVADAAFGLISILKILLCRCVTASPQKEWY